MPVKLLASLMLACLALGGCTLARAGIAALHSTSHFRKLEADNRVLYEPGAEALARQAAAHLPEALAAVEREQYRPFAEPIEVYVCTNEESFYTHTGTDRRVRGAVTTKLFLSGGLNKEPERTARILTHELSHLHLLQRLGQWDYVSDLPPWFTEGLAVIVSGGGGAEKASEAEAIRAILAGKHFTPGKRGGFLFRKYGYAFGLEPPMFYRQSGMFVAFLRQLDPEGFRRFVLALEGGGKFAPSFRNSFGMEIDAAWKRFIGSLPDESSAEAITRRTEHPFISS